MKGRVDMNFVLNEQQQQFLRKLGITINDLNNPSDLEFEVIEEKVADHLQKYGFTEDYSPTSDGIICESILDML